MVLKLSGEAFADPETGFGIDASIVARIAEETAAAAAEFESFMTTARDYHANRTAGTAKPRILRDALENPD